MKSFELTGQQGVPLIPVQQLGQGGREQGAPLTNVGSFVRWETAVS